MKKRETLVFFNLIFIILFISLVSANSVNITYPLNNTNYVQGISSLNYTISGSDLHSCWYSNNSGAWNSTAVSAGTNWTGLTANEGNNNWSVYCSELSVAPSSPPSPNTVSQGVSLYSLNFKING